MKDFKSPCEVSGVVFFAFRSLTFLEVSIMLKALKRAKGTKDVPGLRDPIEAT
jgi:hypothetical protein